MNKVYENIFIYGTYVSYILYILVLLGITNYAPEYLDYLKSFLKLYVGILLVLFYNPFTYKKKQFTNFDRQIAFSAGIFLLLTSTLISGLEQYIMQKSNILINGL